MVARARREWETENDVEGYEPDLAGEVVHSEVDVGRGEVTLEIQLKDDDKKESLVSIMFEWKPSMEDLAALMEIGVKNVNKARTVLEAL